MFFRLPFLIARRVGIPAATPRVSLTRSFAYTPSAYFPASSKGAVTRPKVQTKPKPKPQSKSTTKGKAKSKAKAAAGGEKKKAAAAKKPAFKISQLKVPARRPPTPYLTFVIEQIKKGPKTTTTKETTDRVSALAAQWHTLSSEEKQGYKEKSDALIPKYQAEFKAWLEKTDPSILREINKRRKARGKQRIHFPSDAPKGPVPAFLRFLNDFGAEHPDVKGKELAKQGGAAWHQLPQDRKQVYISAFRDARKAKEASA